MKTNRFITISVLSMLLVTGSALADNGRIKVASLTDRNFHDNAAPAKHKVELGRLLMFDKALSGNKNISGVGGVWDQLAMRLQATPKYVKLFIASFDDINQASDITYAHAASAISAFERIFLRADDSPFDSEQVSCDSADRYKLRTPSLRNVALNAPYGHSGSYNSLHAMIYHHINAVNRINNYVHSQAKLPSYADLDELDFIVMDAPIDVAEIVAHSEMMGVDFNLKQVD
ncbi:MAG: cytochrome c peroxidase [Woeseiaceae bacterium]